MFWNEIFTMTNVFSRFVVNILNVVIDLSNEIVDSLKANSLNDVVHSLNIYLLNEIDIFF